MPVCDARHHLEQSLPPLVELARGGDLELLLVDDGSRDGSAEYARSLGVRVVPSGGRRLGPARARNVGVSAVRAPVVVFVDADVVVRPGAVDGLVSALEDPEHGARVAVYGSYDSAPPEPGFTSRYMNLRHHFYHRVPQQDSPSFWSGLGAVRREAFEAVGGFDADAFPLPSIEDVDLGRRLREAGGRILRDPTLQGTHLKRWSLLDQLRTDVLRRAWPWSRLMARHPGAFAELNVAAGERLRAALALGLGLCCALALLQQVPAWWPVLVLALACLANLDLLRFFSRSGGPAFALAGVSWHQVYYAYSSVVHVLAQGWERTLGGRRA